MLARIAAFEFRYQIASPLFAVAAAVLFGAAFFDMAVGKLLTSGGGNVLSNSPHSIIVFHLVVSLAFLFLGAAFVSNVIVRDDQTGFGPIVRATDITKGDYLFGRFVGAFAVGALVLASATLGQWLGTLMPFADPTMLGPNRLVGYAAGYGLFALPNALIVSSILFALATMTRSTAGTFIGVLGVFCVYLVSQRLMENQPDLMTLRVLADPLGMSAYMAGSRYLTAAELNAGAIPVTGLMLASRALWIGLALSLLALTWYRFRFADAGVSRRAARRRDAHADASATANAASVHAPALASAVRAPLPAPRTGPRAAFAQAWARAGLEARFVFGSPAFPVLLLIAATFALPGLLTASSLFGAPLYPLTAVVVPILEASFATVLVIIATYYGGELVWRDRERGMHEIVDATPLPAAALMLPKFVGLAAVLVATLVVGLAVGWLVQWADGGVPIAIGDSLRWYLLPAAVDAVLVAALSVFVQALSPSKYAGWGLMALYLLVRVLAPSLGLAHPALVYGAGPGTVLSDMAGTGNFAPAAAWFRLYWSAAAVLLLVAAHLLWPRGTAARLRTRARKAWAHASGTTRAVGAVAAAVFLASGAWIAHNTLVLNAFRTADDVQRHLAEYETRYLKYAALPQPVVRHVDLDVALYPDAVRAEVTGRYRLVNETAAPIDEVHVRLASLDLQFVDASLQGARLARDDAAFKYRIYRLDVPMQPGESRTLAFRTRREQRGFRAAGADTSVVPNGTDLDSLELAPRIGMADYGLVDDPVARRELGLPDRQPLPRLEDVAATRTIPGGDVSWTTADITVSTSEDQTPVAPGRAVSDRIENGRRSVRFVSDTPIRNFFSIQSARYAVRKVVHDGIEHAVYFHPAHGWNVDRMLAAMQAAMDYYADAFGPYQFDRMRIVETPSYRSGGQAFANTIPFSENAGFGMDLRDPDAIDLVTMITAHELAHQWWGHQVLGARMQGAGFVSETLAQYSALMVMRRLHGDEGIRRLLQFQRDRYLGERRTQVLAEQPLIRVELGQQHIAYGKGALAMYRLQQRMGEDAVNRALRRFVERYRFTTAPYPRSTDLVALLREEAGPEHQALITDLFERITLHDLKVSAPTAVQRADGKWDVTVPVTAKKLYADGLGVETEAALDETIDIGVFAAAPGSDAFDGGNVLRLEAKHVRSGEQVFHFVTDAPPTLAAIDPHGLVIDRNVDDNVHAVESLP